MPSRGKAKGGRGGRMSLRAFGRHRGVSLTAVQKAIRSGRLRKSVGRDARGPFIVDVGLADREWKAGASKPANGGGHKAPPADAGTPSAPPGPAAGGNGVAHAGGTLVAAQLRVAAQRADALELANRQRRGEVHDVDACARAQFEDWRTLRDRVLNILDRFPDLEPGVRTRIRDELRQALGDVADGLERG